MNFLLEKQILSLQIYEGKEVRILSLRARFKFLKFLKTKVWKFKI